ncbi:MAG: HEAT repeat domain-containing protein [Planctomycetota bacterium]|nr:HEAT repeat domain-containing protein [Planctomycetota bacterium]MDA1114534.1 HEAT repeat domain-containing protein [Planctomycetota bacterium]
MSNRFLPLVLFSLLMGTPAFAQRGGLELPPAPKPKPERTADQVEQEEAAAKAEQVENAPRPLLWAEPDGPAEEVFLRFEMEQDSREVVRKRYLDELRGLGLGTREAAIKALSSPYAPSVHLAAEILEWVGGPSDADFLVDAATRVQAVQSVGVCLETARRLGSGQLPSRASRGLDHPRNQVRGVFEARLSENLNPEYIPAFLQYLQFGRDKDLRLRAARLLADYSENPDARRGLRAALRTDSVEIAMVSVTALSGSGQPEDLHYLETEILNAETSMEAAYLLYAMLLKQSSTSTLLIPKALQPRLRSMLDEEDPFISGVSAATLAECVFRDALTKEDAVLDQLLPFALVRAVGGVVFYPQYARFAPLAESSLRRITGEEFPNQAGSAWITWLGQNRNSFHMVRGHIEVKAKDLSRLRVVWSIGENDNHILAAPLVAQIGDRLVGENGQASLLQIIDNAGLLDAGLLPGTLGLTDAPRSLTIDVGVGLRRKRLTFRGTAGSPWVGKLSDELEELYQQTSWQALAASDAEGRQFLAERLADFDGASISGEERTAALLDLSAGRISALDADVLNNWLSELESLPTRSTYWTDALADEFLHQIPRFSNQSVLAARILDMALTRPNQGLLYPTLEILQGLEEPQRSDLLFQAMRSFAVPDVTSTLNDERHTVRLAAVRSLGKSGNAGITPLITALDDIHPLVVRQAIRGLGEIANPSARGAITPFAASGLSAELRRETMWALGRMGDVESLDLLKQGCLDEDLAIRVAAVSAVAAIPGDESSVVLQELFPAFAGGALETSYIRVVMERGAGATRGLLRPFLIDQAPLVASRAAVLAGALGDPTSALSLMALLAGDPRNTEVQEALASTFAVDFRLTPDPAGTYRAWWADNKDKDSGAWLRKAAADAGFKLADGFEDPTKISAEDSVAVLLDILDRGPAHMRPLTAYFLYALTGVDAPVILARTPRHEMQRRVVAWQAWLKK